MSGNANTLTTLSPFTKALGYIAKFLNNTCKRQIAFYQRFQHYRMIAAQRRQLATMPDYLLKDIGISRADALREAEKGFWEN